jgi:hypothetical protein
MFQDNKNITKLADKVFLYKNFVPVEKVKEINKIMSNHLSDFDLNFGNYLQKIDWYKGKTSLLIPELVDVWNAASELIAPEYIIHPNLSLQVIKPGDGGMFLHQDSPGEGMEEELTQIDRWDTCCIIHYGLVVYFGEFTGGETYYPRLGLESAVQPGDLVIHGAHTDCEHGVREVTSGIRYAYSNFMLPIEKNPGTFPSYNTPEDLERKKKGLADVWNVPIRPANI